MDEQNRNKGWNLTPLLKSEDDGLILTEINTIRDAYTSFASKWTTDNSYLTDESKLKEALDEWEFLTSEYEFSGKVGYYWTLKSVQNQSDPKVKEMVTRFSVFDTEMHNLVQFFELRLAKISKEQQEKFLNSELLKPYRYLLYRTFLVAKYLLSEPEEKILNLLAEPAYSKWVKLRSEFIAKETGKILNEKGELETKSFSEILGNVTNKNQEVRDSAARMIHKIMKNNAPIGEHELNALLLTIKIEDELKGFERPDTSRHVSDDIDTDVVDALVTSTTNRFDIPKRYYKLKAKLLGKKKLKYHERGVEYGAVDKKFSYEEAIKIVSETFNELDSEFGQIFDGFVKNGQIDPYPSKGKRSGAACYQGLISTPTFFYLNFIGELTDLLTIAHEAGHAINNEMIKKSQHALYYGTPLSTAEVASTFMEDFVLKKVSGELDDEKRLTLLMSQLDDLVASIFRQIALYNFETELHKTFREKLYLSHEEIGKLFLKHMSSYMGTGVNMDKGAENWWVYWSHIRSPFYVYSYASGTLISKAMQAKVRQDKSFISQVKTFLSAGTSMSPKDIFSKMGIDITKPEFWEQGIQEIDELLAQAETLAKKLTLI